MARRSLYLEAERVQRWALVTERSAVGATRKISGGLVLTDTVQVDAALPMRILGVRAAAVLQRI